MCLSLNFSPRSVNCTSSSYWHQHEFWIVRCIRATLLKKMLLSISWPPLTTFFSFLLYFSFVVLFCSYLWHNFIRQSKLASHISRQDPSKVHMIITFNYIFCACWESLISHWEENLTWFCWAWWLPGYFVILFVLTVCLSVHYPFSSEFNPVWVVYGSVG